LYLGLTKGAPSALCIYVADGVSEVPTARPVPAQNSILGFRIICYFQSASGTICIYLFKQKIFKAMPQSLSKVYLHVIFSTKNRVPIISEKIRPEAQGYFVKVGSNLGSFTEEIFMMPDHTHWLCTLPRTITIADLVKNVKISSSIKMNEMVKGDFNWQKGYGAFSVSQSKLETVRNYIQNQPEHHKKEDFQTEYRRFLEEYRIEYDEQFVWD
jgi:putative transposase